MFSRLEFNLHVIWAMISYTWFQLSNWMVSWASFTRSKSEPYHVRWPISADLRGKIVIITGSNTGIGRATAEQLGQFGATVVLACRDVKRGRIAEDEVNRSLHTASSVDFPYAMHGKAVFMALDLSDLHKVWEFANEFRKTFSQVDIIINNAGLNVDEVLPNGLKQLFQVNYLGHYLLFRCLQDMLATGSGRKSEDVGRVVNLSSVMHHCGHPNFKVSALSAISSAFTNASSPYDDSKLYMNLFTMEINRRFSEGGVVAVGNTPRRSTRSAVKSRRAVLAVSANPGAVLSDIWRHLPFQTLIRAIFQLFFLNTVQGSATSVYAAIVEEDVFRAQLQPSGDYFSNTGGRMLFHRYLPYLIPYAMPTRSLANEVMGPFAGPRFSYASLPSCSDYFPIQSISRLSHNQRSFSGNNLASISDDSTASGGGEPPINSRAATRMIEFGTSEELASQLWRYSALLCHKVLALSGLSEDELAFLRDEL